MASMQLDTKARIRYNNGMAMRLTGVQNPIKSKDDEQMAIKKVTAICRMDLANSVYHVFAPNGILMKRINYKNDRAKYG
jgi:hypothetical protein